MRIVRVVLGAALAAGLVAPALARAKPPANAPAPDKAKGDKADKADKAKAGKSGKSADVAPLAAALVGGDADAAVKAAQTLGDDASPAAHDALLDGLSTGLSPKVAAAAATALARHPAPADAQILIVYAGHRDDDTRAAATAALGSYVDPASKKQVVAALGDDVDKVRAAAAQAVAHGKNRDGLDRLLALLDKGDAAAPPALAALADADLAHTIAEHLGTAPAGVLAQTLGLIVKRPDFPEPARLEVVRAIAKIPGAEATAALTDYIEATPEKPPRKSRAEAEKIVETRLAGGGAQ
jgi:hypothetical protein